MQVFFQTNKNQNEFNIEAIIIFCFVVFIILCIISAVYNSYDRRRKEHLLFVESIRKEFDRHYDIVIETLNYRTAKRHVEDAQSLLNSSQASLWKSDIAYFESDLAQMKEIANDLLHDHFDEIAHDRASAFSESIYMFEHDLNDKDPTFKTVTDAMNESKKCLKLYDSFFAVSQMEDCPPLDMIAILQEEAEEVYKPCFNNRSDFQKYMDSCIAKINPELKRKKQLSEMIVDIVRKSDRIERSTVLNNQYRGFSKSEVSYCYKDLIQKQRLIEYKPFGRYIVVVGEIERDKNITQSVYSDKSSKALKDNEERFVSEKCNKEKQVAEPTDNDFDNEVVILQRI